MTHSTAGNRVGSTGLILGLTAVFLLCAGLLLFVLDTRKTAHASQQVAREAVASENALRQLLVERCKMGLARDLNVIEDAEADLAFYATLEDISRLHEIPPGTDPKVVALYERQVAAIKAQRVAKQKILDRGVRSSCAQYETPPPV